MLGSSSVDVRMRTVTAPASLLRVSVWYSCEIGGTYVSIDPFQPVLGSVASCEVLQVIHGGNPLGLSGAQEVLLDGICADWVNIRACRWGWGLLVSKGYLDGSVEAVKIPDQ